MCCFAMDDYPVISISHVDDEEGRNRGLWVGHPPLGPIELAGREGNPITLQTLRWTRFT